MSKPLTNVHIHIFDSRCAPERFFRVLPYGMIRKAASQLKSFLSSKTGIRLIDFSSGLVSKLQGKWGVARYLAFTKIGSLPSQDDVFRLALGVGQQYDPSIRLIGLTLNMDYMDSMPSSALNYKNFATQLEEVKNIKRNYPDNFFPFLGVDPRHLSGVALRDWVKDKLTDGHKKQTGEVYPYFYGIKIYPALGFFPFDTALEELYAYAEKYGIPIMTHCTRGGSQYIGDYIQNLIPKNIAPIMMRPPKETEAFQNAEKEIQARIEVYYEQGWVKNSSIGDNDLACDLFSHPQNYIPVLERFPNLKICIAHMGGIGEFLKEEKLYDTDLPGTKKPKKQYKDLAMIREAEVKSQVEAKIKAIVESKVKAEVRAKVEAEVRAKVESKIKAEVEANKGGTERWLDRIRVMMQQYTSLFTDVSYTVSYFDQNDMVNCLTEFAEEKDKSGAKLGHRILFGTDFFMTEQEKKEADLYGLIKNRKELEGWLDGFCRENVERYVRF